MAMLQSDLRVSRLHLVALFALTISSGASQLSVFCWCCIATTPAQQPGWGRRAVASVLLGWELGAGYGHLAILAPLGRALAQQGHQVVLAARDLPAARQFCAKDGFAVEAAPFWKMPPQVGRTGRPTETLAEPLLSIGFAEPETLGAILASWDAIIDRLRPDLVVAEFAPGLALACLGRIPFVTVGTGYSIPPAGRSLPSIRPWVTELSETAVGNEHRLLEGIAKVQSGRHAAIPAFVGDVMAAGRAFVCTVPMLDPYQAYRSEPAVGPVARVFDSFPEGEERKGAFAYLAADCPNMDKVLHGLSCSGAGVEAYVRGTNEAWLNAQARPAVSLRRQPQDMFQQLSRVRVLVHHGGNATTHQGLWAGIPQIIISKSLEQTVTGRAVHSAGAGFHLSPSSPGIAELVTSGVFRCAREDGLAAKARAVARRLQTEFPAGSLPLIEAHVEANLPQGRAGAAHG